MIYGRDDCIYGVRIPSELRITCTLSAMFEIYQVTYTYRILAVHDWYEGLRPPTIDPIRNQRCLRDPVDILWVESRPSCIWVLDRNSLASTGYEVV